MLGVPLFHVERSAETIQFYFDCRGPWPAVLPPDVSSPNMVLFEDGRTGRMDAQKSPSQEKNCMCVCVCQPLFQRVLPVFFFQLCKQGDCLTLNSGSPTKRLF